MSNSSDCVSFVRDEFRCRSTAKTGYTVCPTVESNSADFWHSDFISRKEAKARVSEPTRAVATNITQGGLPVVRIDRDLILNRLPCVIQDLQSNLQTNQFFN